MKLRLVTLFLFLINIVFSQNFHDTQGKLEISSAGQATYTLPIAMPPSLQNVGPIINLTYASGQMGGLAGQGWNISSISSISRMATRINIEGYVDGVDFDDNDKLAFDGQRLILKTGAYWADGSTYVTEVQSNTKIELKGTGTTMYFVVTAPDGSRSWYGNYSGANASDLTAWYITRFEDTNGNYMTYHYTNPIANSLYVSEIKFSANVAGLAPLNTIKFNYKQASRPEYAYIKGVSLQKTQILDYIEVKTNNQLFRKYQLTHTTDEFGYQRVTQLQEFNGALEPANPVVFEYITTPSQSTGLVDKNYTSILNFSSIQTKGDFDGDGKLDFVASNAIYTNLFEGSIGNFPVVLPTISSGYGKSFAATILSGSTPLSKLNQFHSIVLPDKSVAGQISFKVYNLSGNVVSLQYTKTVAINTQPANLISPYSDYEEYFEGDYSGDGVSEVLILTKFKNGTYEYHLLDLNVNTTGPLENIKIINKELLYGAKFVGDYNGDGRADVLVIDAFNFYKIISFKRLSAAPWLELEITGQGFIPDYSANKHLVFGDYNGDSKVDIMIPVMAETPIWRIYYANPKPAGGDFFDTVGISSVLYHPTQSGSTYKDWTDYYAIDMNKDGKSDLVSVYRNYYKPGWTINNHNTKWRVQGFINNLATANTFSYSYESGIFDSPSPEIPMVVTANYKNLGLDSDFVIVRGHFNAIQYFVPGKNTQLDNLLKKVTSSGGNIVDEISYQAMEPSTTLNNGQGALNEFYSSTNSATYPNVEIKKLPTTYLVSQLKNTVEGVTRFQDFRYNGFVVNLHGLGSMGFAKTARSVWYQNATAPRIWSVTENNTSYLRGATDRSYTQLFSQGNAFSFVSPGATPNGIINETTNNYVYYTINNVYNIFLNTQVSQDYLTSTSTQINYTYDSNLLPTTVVSKNMSTGFQSISTTTNTYDNNATGIGNTYYIGRPKTSKTVTTAYGNTSESSMEYYYTNSRLTKTKKKGNTTAAQYLVEDFEYDLYGNIIKKTLSTEGYTGTQLNTRSTEYTYDLSGRFVKTTKDVEGLIATNNSFHPLYGLVTSSTNPFGLTTTSQLDNWGKPTTVTDYLNNSIHFSYTKSGTAYTETKTGDDGSMSIAISDALGRPIKAGSKNIDGSWSYTDQNYDFSGRKYRTSEPYATGSPTLWNTTTYDAYSRPMTITPATGLTTNIIYSGLTVTAADNFKTTTTTKNANGNVVSSSDNGGVINYTYYANGNLKTSNFEGTIISTEYDEWGRKTKLTDPSAGIYTYSYYPTGELLTETTPKGTTTYTLDPATGKLMTKTILGENTDSTTTYNYDATSKLPVSTLFFDAMLGDGATYEYQYDGAQRIVSTVEKTTPATFIHENTYDTFGRLDTEKYTAMHNANGLESTKIIKNTYKNGSHWQILDNDTSEPLWETHSVNARGQLTLGGYGNGVILSNSYDQYGFATQSSNQKLNMAAGVMDDVMTLGYAFEPLRGNLNSRTNSAFAWSETFTYDGLDRLTTYTNAQGGIETQTYDNKGRIATNPVGAYNYTNTAKKYQNTSVTLTPEAEVYYQTEGQQNISYNVFKSPVLIQGKNDFLHFTYNMYNNRSAQYYGGLNKERDLQPLRKYYDATGTMEIKYDIVHDITEFITYIGGDAYSAPIVLKSEGKDKVECLYLHRDYQGSILAITNQAGEVVEKRLFDAWGNTVKVQDINGNDLSGLTVLDRGYTGHEHLQTVGLIHMNGRLYDPKLHRFLQPDNYVQDPYNTQNYNRYGYVLNNPLKYTDPSGEYGVGAAVIIGAAIAAITYTLTALTTDTPFTVEGLAQSVVMGAISAAVTYGIGQVFSTVSNNFFVSAAVTAVAHGAFQGAMTGVQGGNFWQGFAAGAIASIASSLYRGGTNTEINSAGERVGIANTGFNSIGDNLGSGGMIAFGTIMGGAGASLTGGNFWQGAVTGLVVSGLNHAMHQIEDPNKQLAKRIASEYGYDWREVKSFLDANPFELTHKGVAMGGKEALSSKYIEDDKTVVDYVQDQVKSEIQSKIIEFLSPRAGVIFSMGESLLSTQSAHAPGSNYQAEQNQRIEAAKSTLIRYFFQKPATYQTPSMYNNQQSVQYHSSRFDIMQYRHY